MKKKEDMVRGSSRQVRRKKEERCRRAGRKREGMELGGSVGGRKK
jgi:hypothetical protein